MTNHLPPHTRMLAKLMNQPGGLTAEEAVQAAEAKLDTIRDRGLAEIAAMLARVQVIGASLQVERDGDRVRELYKISNALIGVAGVFGLGTVGEVAFSLCTLLDRYHSGATWSLQAVQLHLDSLRALQVAGLSNEASRDIGSALRQVVERTLVR